jgi:hypothetical protein
MGNGLRIPQGATVFTIKGPRQLPGQNLGHKIEGNLLASREGGNAARSLGHPVLDPKLRGNCRGNLFV